MKIAYISERELNGQPDNGGSLKDRRVIELLNDIPFLSTEVFVFSVSAYTKWHILWSDSWRPAEKHNFKGFDLLIISAMPTSPFINFYMSLPYKKVFYYGDSQFHELKNSKGIYSLWSRFLALRERKILKTYKIFYLGLDEVESLPASLRKNALIMPFYVKRIAGGNFFQRTGRAVVIGDFGYYPNRDCIRSIAQCPRRSKVEIAVYGLNIPSRYISLDCIRVVGYVATLEEIFKGARCLIYPSNLGLGIKNKVLEALSFGIPVVGLNAAVTNIPESVGSGVLICKSVLELVDTISSGELERQAKASKSYIRNYHGLEHCQRVLLDGFKQI